MASTLTLLVIALAVSVQGTLAHDDPPSPLNFLKNLNGIKKGEKAKSLGQLKMHLANLGYIDPTINPAHDDLFDDTLEQAIEKYQDFYKLEATGILDSQTLASMLRPRCGVADIRLNHSEPFGDTKYLLSKFRWPRKKRVLTVSFPRSNKASYGPLKNALNRWANVSHYFRFKKTDNVKTADVKISFKRGNHGDGKRNEFDGPLGVLAHSFYPPSGILHFDADEMWSTTKDVQKGKIDLQTVALHELGHILGLAHSRYQDAIMYAFIDVGEKKDLSKDDISGIQAMYHKK